MDQVAYEVSKIALESLHEIRFETIYFDTKNVDTDEPHLKVKRVNKEADFKMPSNCRLFKGNSPMGAALLEAGGRIGKASLDQSVIILVAACNGNTNPYTVDALVKLIGNPGLSDTKIVVISVTSNNEVMKSLYQLASVVNGAKQFYRSSDYINYEEILLHM